MKFFIQLCLLFIFSVSLSAQPLVINEKPVSGKSNTYAIVVGISSYLDPDITPLEFSNRDAIVFADFLMSKSGGSVPKQNIKLLIDSAATAGEIDKAIRWLKNSSQKDDNVFFYFSGHGALENVTMFNNGYLICYNTPSVAFVNLALSIDYLNDVANTLSVQTKANVVVITDACHSGKMAGSQFKGNYLVGEQLMAATQNEIRMASCKDDQLSNEKKDWGDGRGVFSYHLVNGLQGGLADTDQDKVVTLGELKHYMETSMANDPVLKNDGEVQTPVIKGKNTGFPLSVVVQSEALEIKKIVAEDSVSNAMVFDSMLQADEETSAEPEAYFFSLLKKESLENLTERFELHKLPADEIIFKLISTLKTGMISETGIGKLNELETVLKNDKEKLNSFNIDLAGAFIDIGQEVILHYIKGDEAELERRKYYNLKNNGYDIYPKIFAVALKLSQNDKYYGTKSEVLLHYFTGVTLRLKIPLSEDPKPLIEQALNEQKKALALEEHAAYIYNELGILYKLKKDYARAEKNYIKASELSLRWVLPQSNLCGLYASTGKYEKGMDACRIADSLFFATDSLKTGLQAISVNRGLISEKMGNQLFAEEYYHNAIEINSRHFLPYERLGYVQMNTTNYATADSFFYEAELRKKGFYFPYGKDSDGDGVTDQFDHEANTPSGDCFPDTSILKTGDIFGFFAWAFKEYSNKNYSKAVSILKKVITLDKTNPLAFHYVAKIYFDEQKWEEAEVYFKLALKFSKTEIEFAKYVDSVKQSVIYPYDHSCFENYFSRKYYIQIEDYYFIGTIYQLWKHVEEAEKYFMQIIQLNPLDIGGYFKLWQLYETQGRHTEAEEVIKSYAFADKDQSERELHAFYRRIIEKYPDDGNWNYKFGLLLYRHASFETRAPLLNNGKNTDFSDDKIYIAEGYEINYIVPGTKEQYVLANDIYLPNYYGKTYLKRAAELLTETETIADIYFKLGNLYLWSGSTKQAYPYFEKSIAMMPDNANARFILVDIYTTLFKNNAALQQLNYLYDSSQINFQKRMLLAQFNIHAGQFEKANKLLDKAESIYPFSLQEITDLRGRLNLLANKPAEAIKFYEIYIKADSGNTDSVYTTVTTKTGSSTRIKFVKINTRRMQAYTLARLYAKKGKTSEAFKWLESAINYGFNYSFVLQNDPFMDNLRNTAKWQILVGSISNKKHKSNFMGN